jgi:hypothetical protein
MKTTNKKQKTVITTKELRKYLKAKKKPKTFVTAECLGEALAADRAADRKGKQAMYQSVIVVLNDGRKGTFTGPAIAFLGDEGVCRIVDISFTLPKPMPEGTVFGVMK